MLTARCGLKLDAGPAGTQGSTERVGQTAPKGPPVSGEVPETGVAPLPPEKIGG